MSVTWNAGLNEFEVALKRVPQDLLVQANRIVVGEATYAAFAIRSRYPVRTGNLRDKVVVRERQTRRGDIVVTVVNTAKHALIFELGTQARHTRLGANRGSMPPGRVFFPIVEQRRRIMFLKLRDLVAEHGFTVVGDVAA